VYWLRVRQQITVGAQKLIGTDNRLPAYPELLDGSGGPILIISSPLNPFSRYYTEILRTEGLNEFEVQDVTRMTASSLRRHDVVILGEEPLTAAQAKMLATWVHQGGNLIAMRPGKMIKREFGVNDCGSTLNNAYLAIGANSESGRGLVHETIQFHGPADCYSFELKNEGHYVATLYRDATTSAGSPAVLMLRSGAGKVVIFAYDLARSVVYTRQGNPEWSGTERDGLVPMRADDLFFGAASYDPRPDWVDFNKILIPQADEQQRLLANLILVSNAGQKPLPRFWYFPRGLKAVVVMTGDDHGHGGTIGRFERFQAESPANCSIEDWQCVRGTSNVFLGSIADEQAARFIKDGFEIGLHVFTDCHNWPEEEVHAPDGRRLSRVSMERADSIYSRQLTAFATLYPSIPAPTTNRTDCVTWGDFDTQPQVELHHGIRMDTNYYYWPPQWVANRPGIFTGSGMPMRFAKLDGSLIDVYQAATQMTDESGQKYPYTVDTLLDNALGNKEYYGAFTVNMHTDQPDSKGAEDVVASAKKRSVPVVTAAQMLRWLDGRNASSFQKISWQNGKLRFEISVSAGGNGLQVILPMSSVVGDLSQITADGVPVKFQREESAGLEYAAFPASPSKFEAIYAVH
jgi:hypothetical protein